MKKLTIGQLKEGTKGKLIRGKETDQVTGVAIDSRKASPGDVFFAITGEVHDAHKFIPQVLERGCGALVISRKNALDNLSDMDGVNVILVEDTTEALQNLAIWYLDCLRIRKIAVTGSTGKTSTRDLTYAACSTKYICRKNEGNLNNHIGVPLTILSLGEETEVGIFEMGMDRFGEIDRLAQIVRPHMGLITNIGMAHIENLGSQEGIFRAKMEITNYFDEENTLIISQGGEFLQKENIHGVYELITTGSDGKSDYIISDIDDSGADGIHFTLKHDGELQRFELPIPGRHNAWNGALAVAAAGKLGISMKEAADGLRRVELTDKRLTVRENEKLRVIDDTYNASPDSIRSAVDVLMKTKALRRVVILGDMLELGEVSARQHTLVGEYAAQQGVDLLVAIGTEAKHMAEGAAPQLRERALYFKTKEDFLQKKNSIIEASDVVLVKGSRGMAMEEIVRELLK